MKIAQRKHQKAEHKLQSRMYTRSIPSSPYSSLGSPNEMAENTDDELEVDLDVEMTFPNPDSAYS